LFTHSVLVRRLFPACSMLMLFLCMAPRLTLFLRMVSRPREAVRTRFQVRPSCPRCSQHHIQLRLTVAVGMASRFATVLTMPLPRMLVRTLRMWTSWRCFLSRVQPWKPIVSSRHRRLHLFRRWPKTLSYTSVLSYCLVMLILSESARPRAGVLCRTARIARIQLGLRYFCILLPFLSQLLLVRLIIARRLPQIVQRWLIVNVAVSMAVCLVTVLTMRMLVRTLRMWTSWRCFLSRVQPWKPIVSSRHRYLHLFRRWPKTLSYTSVLPYCLAMLILSESARPRAGELCRTSRIARIQLGLRYFCILRLHALFIYCLLLLFQLHVV
jgi:hypothetical protein